MWSLRLKTAPADEPLTAIPDIRDHCRLSSDEASEAAADLKTKITAARLACELATRRQLITATWTLYLDTWNEDGLRFEDGIHVPRPPLQSITTIKYIDTAGNQQTWAQNATGCTVDTPSGPDAPRGRFFPSYGVDWPSLRDQPNAVEVEFVAGYGTKGTDVPAQLREGMKRYVAELYERREEAVLGSMTPALFRATAAWDDLRAY
jgi:uncharacterized phiE125 gp8 family phage protein